MDVSLQGEQFSTAAVTAAARSVRRTAFLAVGVGVGVGVASVAFVAFTVVDAGWNRIVPAALIAGVVLATLVYAAWAIRRASIATPPGVPLQEEEAPALYDLIGDTASQLGVNAPSAVHICPGVDAWLTLVRGQGVLVVGAPLLWGTRAGELQRLLAPEIALMGVVEQPRIRGAFELMSRVRSARVVETTTPGLSGLFRRLVHQLGDRVQSLGVACRAAAEQRVGAVGLLASEADLAEGGIVEEAWELYLQRWAVPAWERHLAPRQLMLGFANVIAALESHEAIERPQPRTDDEPSLGLIAQPGSLDERLSEWISEDLVGLDLSVLEWADYLDGVVEPTQREQTAALFAAVGRGVGRPVPATLDALVGVLEEGWGPAIAAQLRTGQPDDQTGEATAQTIGLHLVAALTTAAVDSTAAFRGLDWAAGSVLVDTRGQRLPVHEWAAEVAQLDAWGDIREQLNRCGVSVDQPLWLSDSAPRQEGYPCAALMVWKRWRALHLVFTDTGLLILRDRQLNSMARGLRNLRGGNLLADRQTAVLQTPVAELRSTFEPQAEVQFADIVSARLTSKRSGWRWRCRLHTPTGTVKVSGFGSGWDVSQLLRAEVGDRLHVRGPVANDAADPRGRALLARWMGVYPGALILAVAGLLALSLMGTPMAAVVDSCTGEADDYGTVKYDCQATVVVDGDSEQTTLHPLRSLPPDTAIEVRVTSLPFGGHLIAQPYETKHMLWPFLVIGLLAFGGGAPFLVLRRRRQKVLANNHRQPA